MSRSKGFRRQHASVAYWADGDAGRIFVIRGEYLVALDANTGKPISEWGDGAVEPEDGSRPARGHL
jgi:hypothetical protein